MISTQTAQLLTGIAENLIGIAVILVTPYAVRALKAVETKAQTIIGQNNYSYAKDYIEGQYKLHADLFTEANLVALLDTLDNKFGDRLSKDTIKRIVDLVIVGAEKAQ